MPRILVADDNSNIHRTVALALKEAGVEVVAVGNGEAAVRKIAEIKPDLVLADIFMPVRSGYEVCEFVKNDPRFSDIPVVLLIGAFDPFDEREAQRVHADGILKKPFVPPDSLLRTVADLLAQSATRVAPVPVAAGVAKAERPSAGGTAASASAREAEPAGYMDEAPEEFAPAKARLEWNANDQPVAFGTLLETPSAETETEDSVVTSRRDPTLGEPAFWTQRAQPEPSQEEAPAEESREEVGAELGDEEQWRSGGALDPNSAQPQGISDVAAPESLTANQESALELPELASPLDPFAAPSTETLDDSAPQLPELPIFELAPADEAPLPRLSSLSATPTFEAPAPEAKPEVDKGNRLPDLKDFSWARPSHPSNESGVKSESVPQSPEKSEDDLIEAAAPGLASLAPFLASLTSPAPVTEPRGHLDFDPIPAFQAESQIHSAAPESAEHLDAPPVSQLDPAVIEAIAQRVIERMQPSLIELVTRELLRPAVEALVQRELEKK